MRRSYQAGYALRGALISGIMVLFASFSLCPAHAQTPTPGSAKPAVKGTGPAASNGPITIEADRAEVLDKEKRLIYSGNVVAVRGDMTVRAAAMTVFYDGDAVPTPNQAAPERGNQSVRRINMTGKVFFSQNDQQATGDTAIYERTNETLTLEGNVILTKCQNVATGPKLVVNLRTNQAQLEGQPGSRVRTILVPNEAGTQTAPGCAQAAAPLAPPAALPKRKP